MTGAVIEGHGDGGGGVDREVVSGGGAGERAVKGSKLAGRPAIGYHT